MTNLVNLTPHALTLVSPDGTETVVPPSGTVARVSSTPGTCEAFDSMPCMVATPTIFGAVIGLPDPVPGTVFIVSGMVGSAMCTARTDVMMPGTGPNDGAIRNAAGHIVGVTRLLRVA